MAQLLTTYSIHEILVFIIILALGIKGFITFWDWAAERLRKFFHKENQQDLDREKIQELSNDQTQILEDIQRIFNKLDTDNGAIEKLSQNQEKLIENVDKMANKIDSLVDSEKADIKAYITEKHHYYVYEKKWIDDHTLESLEKRFEYYQKMGGNSFVEGLMSEIRKLPKGSAQP